jgi:hypothetical protein
VKLAEPAPFWPGYERTIMRVIPRINYQNATGLLDKIAGLGKEIAGTALDQERLIRSGEAQQDKGSEKLQALRAEAKAQGHEAKARAQETKQKDAQQRKPR